MTKIEFQELSGQDVDKIADSYAEAFPEVPEGSIINLLEWKFFSGLNPGNYWTLTSEDGSEIAGGYGILRMPISNGTKYGLVADVYTTPKYQKMGVFTELGEAVRMPVTKLGYDFAIGFPIRPNVLPGHIKVGWREAFSMPVWGSIPIAKALSGFFRKTRSDEYILSKEYSEATKEVLDFLENRCSFNHEQKLVASNLTEEYLNWRLGRPSANYIETVFRDSNGIQAWIVSRKVRLRGMSVWVILDMHFNALSVRQIKLVMSRLACLAVSNKCLILAGCWNPSYAKYLNVGLMMGFFQIGKQSVIYRSHNPNLGFPAENEIRLSWLDSDTL